MKFLFFGLFLTLPLLGKEAPAGAATAEAAEKFLLTLDAEQKSKAALPFAGVERENFRYTPRERAGLPIKEMSDAQREAAMKLLASALSEKGNLKAQQVMKLEGIIAEIEKDPVRRDTGKYFVTIFGKPGDPSGWAWRFEGHHISINITLVEGKGISVTPSFLGANPAEVADGPSKGLRVLAEEEDLARSLVTTLLAAGKSEVVFSDKAPGEILTGEKRSVTLLDPVGILSADMTAAQRAALMELISTYTGRYRPEIAATDMAKMEKAGLDQIRFGWAGSTKPNEAYYYRIQGPSFLMEAVNSQNNVNHMHATWRDFKGDFGRDLLGEHFKEEH